MILSSVITFSTGFVLEKIFHRKWWDYSRKRFQFGGYVNLPYTIVWGLSAVICISFINLALKDLLALIPSNLGTIILIILYIVLCLDLAGTVIAIKAVHSRLRKLSIIEDVSENLQKAADMMGEGLTGWVQKHMAKAYPSLEAKELLAARQEKNGRWRQPESVPVYLLWAVRSISWSACFSSEPSWEISPRLFSALQLPENS